MIHPAIFRFELRTRLKSALIWSLAMVGVSITYLGLYPSLAPQTALFDQALASFPPQFLQAFGLQNLHMDTIMGFYSMVFLFIQMLLAVQAALYGFGLVARDEIERTADFLLTRPVSRADILTSKYLAAFVALTLTNGVVWVSSLAFLERFNAGRGYDIHATLLLLSSIPIFQLIFLTVGVALSLLVKRIHRITPYALGLATTMYILGAFGDMLGDHSITHLSPFAHFSPNTIIQQHAWNLAQVSFDLTIILIAILISYWRYLHRDILAAA